MGSRSTASGKGNRRSPRLGAIARARRAVSLAVVPLGLGLGLLFPLMTVVSQRHAPPPHLGVATAMPIMLRALGGAMGVSVLGSVLSHGMSAALGAKASAGRGSEAVAGAGRPAGERVRSNWIVPRCKMSRLPKRPLPCRKPPPLRARSARPTT